MSARRLLIGPDGPVVETAELAADGAVLSVSPYLARPPAELKPAVLDGWGEVIEPAVNEPQHPDYWQRPLKDGYRVVGFDDWRKESLAVYDERVKRAEEFGDPPPRPVPDSPPSNLIGPDSPGDDDDDD